MQKPRKQDVLIFPKVTHEANCPQGLLRDATPHVKTTTFTGNDAILTEMRKGLAPAPG
jgi:hypothetical protein